MNIPTTNKGIISTDSMPDIKALIAEKSEELFRLCAANNIKCALMTDGILFHHYADKKGAPRTWENIEMRKFWGMINSYVINISGGSLAIKPNIPESNDNSESWKRG